MQVTLTITRSGAFAGWESGFFNPEVNCGASTILADKDGGELDVIYHLDPLDSRDHFLMVLKPECLVANAQITPQGEKTDVRLTLSRIESFSLSLTTPDAIHPRARAEHTDLWATHCMVTSLRDLETLPFYTENVVNYSDVGKNLLQLAVSKALTSREEQRLFWGRKKTTRN